MESKVSVKQSIIMDHLLCCYTMFNQLEISKIGEVTHHPPEMKAESDIFQIKKNIYIFKKKKVMCTCLFLVMLAKTSTFDYHSECM